MTQLGASIIISNSHACLLKFLHVKLLQVNIFPWKPIIAVLGWIMMFAFSYLALQRVRFVGVAGQLAIASSMGRTRKLVKQSVLSKSCVRSQDE